MPEPFRLSVRGSAGVGKSTLARRAAERTGVEFFDLDDWFWGPDWTERGHARLQAVAERELALRESWTTAGNYRAAMVNLRPRLTDEVWLDYPFALALRRVLRRTARRLVLREPCCNGNHESLVRSFGPQSLVWWMVKNHRVQHERALAAPAESPARRVHVFTHPPQAEAWLESLPSPSDACGHRTPG